MPSLPYTANTIGPGLYQVFRRVVQVCDVQDVFFIGKRVSGMPSTWQYIQEFLRPGKQITTSCRSVGLAVIPLTVMFFVAGWLSYEWVLHHVTAEIRSP